MIESEMIAYMTEWAVENGCTLQLKGQVGFGRPAVGILHGQSYVDYNARIDWDDRETWGLTDEIWTPEDSYHKHDCLAVLVRGDEEDENAWDVAREQLFHWVKWLKENNWKVEVRPRETFNKDGAGRQIELLMGGFDQAILMKAA